MQGAKVTWPFFYSWEKTIAVIRTFPVIVAILSIKGDNRKPPSVSGRSRTVSGF